MSPIPYPSLSWRLDINNHFSYHDAMIITIDPAGRVVVPKSLRDRFNLVAGTKLEVEATANGLRLRKIGVAPSLVRKKGILVHHGAARTPLDITEFIRAERDARSRRTPPEVAD